MPDRIDQLLAGILDDPEVPGKRPLKRISSAAPQQDGPQWDERPLMKSVKGVPTEFFTIGDLAVALGRQPVTIRSWERKGWLPKSPYRTQVPKGEQVPGKAIKGRRLYTRVQIEAVIKIAHACGVMIDNGRFADWSTFRATVAAHWRTLS